MKKKFVLALAGIGALYALSYGLFRVNYTEVWEKDGRSYVIFPKNMVALYYCYRPIAYVDGAITGIGLHIGPHQ